MVLCRHCSIPNSLDSTFCKRCGTALPEEDLQEAQVKLDALIAEGMSALNAGKVEEATAIAETAIASNPSSVPALTLKANCHERHGEIAEALECAEKIVELNPDSELDKITRNRLRSALMSQARKAAPMDRRYALSLAGLVAVVLICSGLAWAKISKDNRDKQLLVDNSNTPIVTNPNPTSTQSSEPTKKQDPAPQADTNTTQSQTTPRPAPRQGDVPPVSSDESSLPPTGNKLPLPNFTPGTAPVSPSGPIVPELHPTNPPTTTTTKGNKEDVDPQPNPEPPKPSAPVEKPEYGIKVYRNGHANSGGSQPVGSGGVEAYLSTGRSQFQIRNYAGAAANFENALRYGADPTTVNMRLGQSYERLGRTSDAINAYNRAIQACDKLINSGKANSSVHATADACRQAVKVLQGG